MFKDSVDNSDNSNSLQAETPGNAQKENNNKLIEMAAEQFASLLSKHSILKKSSKGKQNKPRPGTIDQLPIKDSFKLIFLA